MLQRPILAPTILTLVLAALAPSALAEQRRFEKYFVEKDMTQRWRIPSDDEEVVGEQNFWFVTPQDVRKGAFNFGTSAAKISDFSDKSFCFVPNSVWGEYVWRVVPLESLAPGTVDPPDWSTVNTRMLRWASLPDVKQGLLIQGTITKVSPGTGFEAVVPFKDGPLRVRFEVVKEVRKAEFPDVHSRLYGPHWHQTFDVYYPDGFKPGVDPALPVLFNIHGGGWGALDKQMSAKRYNERGIACISINYRFVGEYKQHPAMTVPVAAPLLDAARAVQHIKYHAKELGIDPDRICLTGGSAGGASSAWLAMVDDLADPASQDPIARMSTRVACSLPCQAQTSLDPKTMREWIPGITYGAHAFFARNKDPQYGKLKTKEERFQYFLDRRKEILPLIRDFSAYEQASADDPPMLLSYGGQKDVMPPSGDSNATHHPKFGEHLHKRLQELGVPSWYWADNVPEATGRYNGWMGHFKFLDDHLKREK